MSRLESESLLRPKEGGLKNLEFYVDRVKLLASSTTSYKEHSMPFPPIYLRQSFVSTKGDMACILPRKERRET